MFAARPAAAQRALRRRSTSYYLSTDSDVDLSVTRLACMSFSGLECERVRQEARERAEQARATSEHRLEEWIGDVEFNNTELNNQRSEICRELEALAVYRTRLQDCLDALLGPLDVCRKCILLRANASFNIQRIRSVKETKCIGLQYNARDSAAMKLVMKTSQWCKMCTRGRRMKGRGALNLCIAPFAGNSERQNFVRCTVQLTIIKSAAGRLGAGARRRAPATRGRGPIAWEDRGRAGVSLTSRPNHRRRLLGTRADRGDLDAANAPDRPMEARLGIDLVVDDVEKALRSELNTIVGGQNILKRTLEQTVEQIRRLRAARYALDRALQYKQAALDIDRGSLNLRPSDGCLSVYEGYADLDPAWPSPPMNTRNRGGVAGPLPAS
ncbi:Tektin-5 [Eumeta japonica]|uniref:Tektin n=1 Tax=Eumeta variegata TaxID=151549 RepID=A0A4C1UXJ7_EUMVA|nr:Tektin-5 [Eumeta japonica]